MPNNDLAMNSDHAAVNHQPMKLNSLSSEPNLCSFDRQLKSSHWNEIYVNLNQNEHEAKGLSLTKPRNDIDHSLNIICNPQVKPALNTRSIQWPINRDIMSFEQEEEQNSIGGQIGQ